MGSLLQANWFVVLVGGLLYLTVTTVVMLKAKLRVAPPKTEQHVEFRGPSWDYFNPEIDRLIAELKQEKQMLVSKQQQLKEWEARLQAEQAELVAVTQAVHRIQQDLERNNTRVKEDETASLKKLAKLYTTMSRETALTILKQSPDDEIVKVLSLMRENDSAPLLELLAKSGPEEARRAALLIDRLKMMPSKKTP